MEVGPQEPRVVVGTHAELAQLRARAAELESKLHFEGLPHKEIPKAAAAAAVAEVWPRVPQTITSANTVRGAVVLKLSPEKHDERMADLIAILQAKGVASAIATAEESGNPHLIDDFQRVLVEYVHEGFSALKIPSTKSTLGKALNLSLLEITLPRFDKKPGEQAPPDPSKKIRDFISLMEQFYRGTLSIGEDSFFSFELANPAGQTSVSAYLAIPTAQMELFEKQLLGLFPTARIKACPDDYNVFADNSYVAAAEAELTARPIFGLRTFDEMTNDSLDTLLSSFSQLDRSSEGAALQFVILPSDRHLNRRYRKALEEIRKGVPIAKATKMRRGILHTVEKVVLAFKPRTILSPDKRPGGEDPRIKAIERKIQSPLLHVNVRAVACAQSLARAEAILQSIEAPFNQYGDGAGGNQIAFQEVSARAIKRFAHTFSYRLFEEGRALPLSAAELASMAHLPRPESSEAAPELHQEKNAEAPAPAGLPSVGTLIGINRFRGVETPINLLPEDRLRHLYLIGQTGTGKSNLLKNVIMQDINGGNGVCFIDPHGSDVLDILSSIPPERVKDVIYFDPGSTERPMALNMLEYDLAHPEQKTLVVDELLGIFNKLFDMKVAGGPAFEQYFRNAALLVMEDPESGNTLLDIARIFSDDSFRHLKLSRCKNPIVVRFWEEIASKATGEQGLQNYAPYITNKFDVFTTNEIMRPIIAQQKSSFNFRELMDERKILLVNLAKGRVGDINANLLGLIIVGKFLLAALSRSDSFGGELPPFYLHIDEFQNFTTPSISTILSEARKYKLSLTIAHQFIAQLAEDIRDAVFGNVGSLIAFRVGADDAEFLEKQFTPKFTAGDLMRVDNYRAFVRMLSQGRPMQPFNIETLPYTSGSRDVMERLRELSSLTYGRPRAEIEAEIAKSVAIA